MLWNSILQVILFHAENMRELFATNTIFDTEKAKGLTSPITILIAENYVELIH